MISNDVLQDDQKEISMLPFQYGVNQVGHIEGEATLMCNRKKDVCENTK